MKTLLLTLAVLLTSLTACENTNNDFVPTLPPITQTGENTFGCYIDGKLLTPRNGTGTIYGPDPGMSFIGLGDSPNYIYNEIRVHDFKSATGGIMDIHLVNLHENGEGSFSVNESNCNKGLPANATINIRCRINNKWYCSIANTGELTILRYDYWNAIVSGTFSCSAVNRDDSTDIIEITQGRFDIHWPTTSNVTFP